MCSVVWAFMSLCPFLQALVAGCSFLLLQIAVDLYPWKATIWGGPQTKCTPVRQVKQVQSPVSHSWCSKGGLPLPSSITMLAGSSSVKSFPCFIGQLGFKQIHLAILSRQFFIVLGYQLNSGDCLVRGFIGHVNCPLRGKRDTLWEELHLPVLSPDVC